MCKCPYFNTPLNHRVEIPPNFTSQPPIIFDNYYSYLKTIIMLENYNVIKSKHIPQTGNFLTIIRCTEGSVDLGVFGVKKSQKTYYVFGSVQITAPSIQLDDEEYLIRNRDYALPQGSTDRNGVDTSGKVIQLKYIVGKR